MAAVNTEVTRLEKETDDDTESIITDERYTYIGSVIDKAVKKSGKKLSTSDKIPIRSLQTVSWVSRSSRQ